MKFRFIKHHKFKFTVEKMCKILKVSTSGYYSMLKAKVSKLWLYNQKLSELITSIFKDSFESYGAPRIKIRTENQVVLKPELIIRKSSLKAQNPI